MDINKLKQIVKAGLSNGIYSLQLTKLDSVDIDKLARDYFPDLTFSISPANEPFQETSDSITVLGVGIDLPFTSMSLEARFYLIEQNAALNLKALGNSTWKLSTAFPSMAKNLGDKIRFSTSAGSPAFHLLSNNEDDFPAGLNFAGDIDFSKMTAGLGTLLGISTEGLSGQAKVKNGGKELENIDFSGPEHKGVDLWIAKDCTVQFSMLSFPLINPFNKAQNALPYLKLATIFPFSANNKSYELPVAMSVTNFKSPMRFEADITDLVDATLDALGAFSGGVDLSKTLPPEQDFPIGKILRFKQLYVDIDVQGTKIVDIGMQIGSATDWKIVEIKSTGKTLYATDMNLGFVVIDPFSGSPKPYLNLSGGIRLTERATLMIAASYPNFMITGYLAEKSLFSIKEFIEQFAGPSPSVPELYVAQLDFNLQSGNYSFAVDITGYWPINSDQSLALIINELGFSLSYTPQELIARFTGTLTIGTVAITVTADYQSNIEKKGWKFTGKTGPGQKIPFGEFIDYLAKTFGAGKPPEWVSGMTLQDLDTSLETDTKNFTFYITGTIPLAANKSLVIKPGFELTQVNDNGVEKYKKWFSCEIYIGKSIFRIDATDSPSETSFAAKWAAKDPSGYLQIADIAHAFGFETVPQIPENLDLALKEAILYYNFKSGEESLVLAAQSANYGEAVFVAKKLDNAWTYIFGLKVSPDGIDLAHLPLVGSDMEKVVGPVALKDFKIVIATKDIKEEDVKAFNKLILDKAGIDYPTIPEVPEGVQAGVYAAIELALGTSNTYEIQISTANKKKTIETLSPTESSGTDSNVYWLNLQKAIGPVYLDKVGVGYQSGKIGLMLNASLLFTALKINLIELGAYTPLTKIDPSFTLSGLTISYESGPISINGGFLKKDIDGVTQYFGSAGIAVKVFNLSALGAYANYQGHPSLFIFAMMNNPPLGGPPAFFVTGLAGGFGYNRGLTLPDIDNVATFPLVSGFVPGQASPFKGDDPNKALQVLVEKNVVPVKIGQNWIAAGVQFTSFQLLQSYALLSVAFGTNLEIGFLGMSTVSAPPKSPVTLAYAQLAIAVRILPDQGLVAVEAKLTPASYVISKDCKLTGGFAFYLWSSPNTYAGDFVVTLGGYHPNFKAPSYYPKVPRLGLNWVINAEISIKGGMYFALTPSSFMAGGGLEAVFQAGGLKAWFKMGVDFLISWKPFHYEASLYISFGVSYTFRLNLLFTTVTKTISVSLGADLAIWGPEFSGIANIHLWIISFKISFGASTSAEVKPISWEEFKESFFPPVNLDTDKRKLSLVPSEDGNELTTTYCVGRINRGLIEDLSRKEENELDLDWIVNRAHTTFETGSLIPAKEYQLIIKDEAGWTVPKEKIGITNEPALKDRNIKFGVGMVDVDNEDFQSEHIVVLTYSGSLNQEIEYEVTAIIGAAPKSLWDKGKDFLSGKTTVNEVLTGFYLTPLAPVPKESLPIDLEKFQYHFNEYRHTFKPNLPVIIQGPDVQDPMQEMQRTIDSVPVRDFRKRILERLQERKVNVNSEVNVHQLAESAEDYLLAAPEFEYNYWKNN